MKKLHASIPTSAQASTYIPPLADPSYRVQVPCSSGSHPSWPAGICTKCQPSAVTLSRQTYRMTDHVEFATPSLIDGLLSFWRSTGTQRFGYLLGTYQPYDKVPMGVKAVVEAIHEPPQEPLGDGITVGFPWEEESKVEALAQACGNGLEIVGIVYTDLTQDLSSEESKKLGKVVAKRHANSFFLSSLEVLFSARLQKKFPTKSRFSIDGKFSSRFVTCVVSGDIEGQISVEAYQVSDQAMAMVDADMVEASVDPGVVRVKEEGKERYIPDVFYRYKNKYGLEVKDNAKPCFPVEYLIVNVRSSSHLFFFFSLSSYLVLSSRSIFLSFSFTRFLMDSQFHQTLCSLLQLHSLTRTVPDYPIKLYLQSLLLSFRSLVKSRLQNYYFQVPSVKLKLPKKRRIKVWKHWLRIEESSSLKIG